MQQRAESRATSSLHLEGISLGQAALIAGAGLLIMALAGTFVEMMVWPRLVIGGDIEATVSNILAHRGLYLAGIFAYFLLFIFDVVLAWALYILLAPVNRALSMLTAWFRIVYTVIALAASLRLVTVYRLLQSPEDVALLGDSGLHAQVNLLLDSFRYEWSFGLILFGIYLLMLAYLVFRSGYIPRFLGVLLAIAGAAWVIGELGPFFWPGANLDFLMVAYSFELVFMLWLLIRGRKLGSGTPSD